jgi:gliding motility-associated-like protein
MSKVSFNGHFHKCLSVIVILFLSAAAAKAQAVTSTPVETGTYGTLYIYNITTGAWINPVDITVTTPLPTGVELEDNTDGTAILTGLPEVVGLFPITIKVTDRNLPILSTTQSFDLNIEKAVLTATIGNTTREYGEPNPVFPISYSGFKFSDGTEVLDPAPVGGDASVTGSASVGNHSIGLLSSGTYDRYTISVQNGTLEITPAPLTITAEDKTKIYGSANPLYTVVYSGFKNGETPATPGVLTTTTAVTTTVAVTATSPVDEYIIRPSNTVAPNYTISHLDGTLSITKKLLTAKADDKTKVYGTNNPPYTITYSGFVGLDTEAGLDLTRPTASTDPEVDDKSHVNDYIITVSGGIDKNYTFDPSPGVLHVTKATLTATADAKTKIYGNGNPVPPLTITYTGLLNDDIPGEIDDAPDISTTATPDSPVDNDYTISLAGGSDNNYDFILQGGLLSVTPAPLSITAVNDTRKYGAANPVFAVTYSGFVNGDGPGSVTPGTITSVGPTATVGNHDIDPAGFLSANYSITHHKGILDVTKATITVKANDETRQYGALEPPFTATYSGFMNGQNINTPGVFTTTPTGTTDAGTYDDIGNYNINFAGGQAVNYAFDYVSGVLAVTQAPLTLKADNKTKIYRDLNPPLTISYTGFRGDDGIGDFLTQPGITTTAQTESEVIDPPGYPIIVAGGSARNYAFSYEQGTLMINKAALVARAVDYTRKYGELNPVFTLTYSGFLGTDGPGNIDNAPGMKTTAGPTSGVNNYGITLDPLNPGEDDNYEIAFIPGMLSVTKAMLTAKADNKTRNYGVAEHEFTVTYTGFANSETATVIGALAKTRTDATINSNVRVSNYTIEAYDASDDNYDFTYQPGILTITKAPLTLTADNKTRVYGGPNPELTITYSGFKNGETPIVLDEVLPNQPRPYASTVNHLAGVGNHLINIVISILDNNYEYTPGAGMLRIDRATLNVKANDATRPFKTANPEFILTYTGFQNDDDLGDIDDPAATTDANINSPVGSYSINVGGGVATNYTFSYTSANLTISKASPVVTWNPPAAITYGTPLGAGQLNATASVPGVFEYFPPNGILTAGVRTLSVNFSPSDSDNYNPVIGTTVSITVNKQTPIITWPIPAAITYGTQLTTAQLGATSNVPGTFTYNYALNTVLNAGLTVLEADFVPNADNINNYNSVENITRQLTVNKANPVITWNNPAPITYGTPLGGIQQNSTLSVRGDSVYVPGPGTILPPGDNQAIAVNWKPRDQVNYNDVTKQVLITVVKATPVITWPSPADITYGTTLNTTSHLNPTHNVPGEFTFDPLPGVTLAAGSHTLTATFKPDNQTNYNIVTGITTTINVVKANPVITWATPAAITYGTALDGTQLNASSGGLLGGFAYVPPATTVLNAGNRTLTATFTATNPNYNVIVTTRPITVNLANPVITWPNPASITYGTPLALGVHLKASANVPGQYTYVPRPDSVLNTGVNQVLSVKFVPTDQLNYNTIPSATALITVTQATPVVTFPAPLPIKVGVPLTLGTQLNATANVAGVFTYTPNPGTSFASEGTYTLSVKFEPSDALNYAVVPVTQTQITVSSKDNPVVTWNDPAPITYGTALAAGVQLNATANVAGTFDYTQPAGTVLNAGNNQTLTVTFRPDDQVNYNNVVKTSHINVNKKPLTVTGNSTSRPYGSPNPVFTVSYSGFVGLDHDGMIENKPTASSTAAIASVPAGSTFNITPEGGGDNNYSFNYVNGTLTIVRAPLIAKAENKSREYGVENPPFTIAYTGLLNNDDPGVVTGLVTKVLGPGVNAGEHTIELTGGSATNYDVTVQNGTLTITKVLLVIIGNELTKVYGQINPELTFRYIGFRGNDTDAAVNPKPTVTTVAGTNTGVGVHTFSLAGGSSINYTIALFPGSLTITKAPLTVKVDNKSRPYRDANPPTTLTYIGLKGSDGPGVVTQLTITGPGATPASDAGIYPITLSGGTATNYELTLQNGALTVNKAVLNAKADNKSRLYGQENPAEFTITYTGFLGPDNLNNITITRPTATTTADSHSKVDSYLIIPSGGTATNYSFSYQNGTLTVDPAPLIARANDRTRMYGQANPAVFTITYTGFVNDDDVTDISPPTASAPLAGPASTPGTYTIGVNDGSATNYTLTRQSGTLTIAKATLTAKVENKTRQYGSAPLPNTITYTGFVGSDHAGSPGFVAPLMTGDGTTTTSSSPVGTYTVNLSGGTSSNYAFILQSGTVTITQASLTARVDNQSRDYGDTNPDFTITYTGFVNGNTPASITKPTITTAAGPTSPVGIYDVTLSGTTTNYAFTFVNGTLTVNKATVTIHAENDTKVYGDENPPLTVSYSGLLNNETIDVIDTAPTAGTIATAASPVGTYPITASGGLDNNYKFTYVPGTLSISKASLTATADNKQKFYGDENPENTITYTGFVNGDGPTSITEPGASTTATTTSPLGDYPIVLTGGSATNYTLTLQPGTLSIIPALLTVTAENKARTYGASNPPLTLSYSGFTSGHSIADLDVVPVVSTMATTGSAAGTYAINVSGGVDPNYTFAYAPGTLTVDKATVTATADVKTSTYGTIPPLTISYTGFVNGEDKSVIDEEPSISTTATVTSSPSPYSIDLTGGSDNNYTFVYVGSTLTITKAPLIAKADNQARITGVANPPLTISYIGFKNDETSDQLDELPQVTTIATVASPPGVYPISVSGGADNNYQLQHEAGELAILLDGPPVAKNFQVETDEDNAYVFNLAVFKANVTDEPGANITFIKVVTLPQHGALLRGNAQVVSGDNIAVTNGVLESLRYVPNSNYVGTDNFNWNLSDGNFTSASNGTVSLRIKPVNDPPVLTNIEPDAILYSPGDPELQLTKSIIVNDIDDSYVQSATVSISSNYTNGDLLSVAGISTKITASFDAQKGELNLTGYDIRGNYETALRKVMFTSSVNASATISDKNIRFVVRDSVATSNAATRVVSITEVLPELDIVNAFTPNGDGVNDKWDVLNLQSYSEIDIRVFDSHGNLVFKCIENVCEWDGTFKERALPAGPYLYSINLNNGKRKYTGMVMILK